MIPARRRDAAAVMREAQHELEQAPVALRRRVPLLWGKILLAVDVEAFEAALDDILEALRTTPCADSGMRLTSYWLTDRKVRPAARARLEHFLNELPAHLVESLVKLRVTEAAGLRALEHGDLRSARVALKTMTHWAPFAHFPGNVLALVDATIAKGVLRAERRAYLTAVLRREWRPWHRPEVEERLSRSS